MKLPAALAELLLAVWMWRRYRARSVWYCWCPIPLIEFWGQGHNDALLVLFLFGALEANRLSGRPGIWLGLAAAVKWWPLALLPATARRWTDWLWAGAIPAAFLLPYASGLSEENLRFATGFLGGWRNNDSLFGLVFWLSDGPYAAKHITLALCGVLVLALARAGDSVRQRALWTVTGLLLLSANVHPWYLTWLLPFAVEGMRPGLLVWLALSPLFYETVIWWQIAGEWRQSPDMRWLVYGPAAGAAILAAIMRGRRRPEGPERSAVE
jgi:hypothetical protein